MQFTQDWFSPNIPNWTTCSPSCDGQVTMRERAAYAPDRPPSCAMPTTVFEGTEVKFHA